MPGQEYFNSDIYVEGKIKLTILPNSQGSIVVYNTTLKELSTRTNEEFISDLDLSNKYWQIYNIAQWKGIGTDKPFAVFNGAGAQTILAGGLTISSLFSDEQYQPANGIYSKGTIKTELEGNSTQWNQAYNRGDFRDYGLGVSVPNIGNVDDQHQTGFYFQYSGSTGTLPYNFASILHMKYTDTEYAQLAIQQGADGMSYRRNGGNWHRLIDDITIQGYATQSWVSGAYLPLTGGTLTGTLIIKNNNSQLMLTDNVSLYHVEVTGGAYRVVKTGVDVRQIIRADGVLQINTDYDLLSIGAQNSTWCHFSSTNLPFYFNQDAYIKGDKVATTPWVNSNFVTTNTIQDILSKKRFYGATSNDYIGASIMVNGNGSTNTIYPSIGFHQAGMYAAVLSYHSNAFQFKDINGVNYEQVVAGGFYKAGYNDNYILLAGGGQLDKNALALANGTNASGQWGNFSAGLGANPGNFGSFFNSSGASDLLNATYGQGMGYINTGGVANGCPDSNWWYRLKFLHSNSSGFFGEIGLQMTGGGSLRYRRMENGTQYAWVKVWDSTDFSTTNIGNWNSITIEGIRKNVSFDSQTSGVTLTDNYYGGDVGLVNLNYDQFIAGLQVPTNQYKYGSGLNDYDGINITVDNKKIGLGNANSGLDKVEVYGDISVNVNQDNQLILNPIVNTNGDLRELRNDHIYVSSSNNVTLPNYPIEGQHFEIYNDSNTFIDVKTFNGNVIKLGAYKKLVGTYMKGQYQFQPEFVPNFL